MFLVNALCIAIIAVIVLLAIIGNAKYKKELKGTSFREKMSPLGLTILDLIGYSFKTSYDRKILRRFNKLYGHREAKDYYRLYLGEKIGLGILVIAIFCFITVASSLNNLLTRESIDNKGGFNRGDSDRSTEVTLIINNNNETYDETIEVKIPKAGPTDAEINEKLKGVKTAIQTNLQNLKEVRNSLKLPKSFNGVTIGWASSDIGVIDPDGVYSDEGITDEGREIVLYATLFYGGKKEELSHTLIAYPTPDVPPTNAELAEVVKKELEDGKYNSRERVNLPTGVNGLNQGEIAWKEVPIESGLNLLIFGFIIGIAIFFLSDEDLKKNQKEKDLLIQLKFPDMIAKYVLLINAGMTMQNAWKKICTDYLVKKEKLGITHPLYEEMILVLGDLKGGVSEADAYEKMGKRVDVKEIKQFTKTLSSSLKRGNSDLLIKLMQMSTDAWENRISTAKRLGEEAGTKLLFPMVIMLFVVVGIVMYPAMSSFNL